MNCNAYCKSGEGIHALVEYIIPGKESGSTKVGGQTWVTREGHTCLPKGTKVEVLSKEPAVEAPDCPDPRYGIKELWLVKIIEVDDLR